MSLGQRTSLIGTELCSRDTGAIVGARSPRQVDGWLPAATLELKDDDVSDIAAAIQATGAGTGPASPVQ